MDLDALAATPPFGLALTLALWSLALALSRRTGWVLANPVVVTIAAVIGALVALDVPYEAYAKGGDLLLFLLGPAVVALAVPLYERRREIAERALAIGLGTLAGAVTSVATASGIAWLLGASDEVVRSMAPKSATTPIAIAVVEPIGGLPALTACVVVLTGCLGALVGPELCRRIGIRSEAAMGLAVGSAAHGIGTARMLEVGALAGAVSGLAIGLQGLATAAVVPWVAKLLGW